MSKMKTQLSIIVLFIISYSLPAQDEFSDGGKANF